MYLIMFVQVALGAATNMYSIHYQGVGLGELINVVQIFLCSGHKDVQELPRDSSLPLVLL